MKIFLKGDRDDVSEFRQDTSPRRPSAAIVNRATAASAVARTDTAMITSRSIQAR